MKKILSLALAMLFIVSMAAGAATVQPDGSVTNASGDVMWTSDFGFKVTVANVTPSLVKATIALTGTINNATSVYCTLSFDSANLTLVDAANNDTAYTAGNTAIKADFAEDLGYGVNTKDYTTTTVWSAKSSKIGFSTGPVRGYATLGVERNSPAAPALTFVADDWYNVYFKVKDGITINKDNFGSYIWAPITAGPDISKVTTYTVGIPTNSTATESIAMQTGRPTDVDTINAAGTAATTIKTKKFETVVFKADEKAIHTTITGSGKVLIDGAKVANDSTTPITGTAATRIKIIPALGYEISGGTIGTTPISDFISKAGGTFKTTITAATELSVTFEPVADAAKPQLSPATYHEVGVNYPKAKGPHNALTSFAKVPTSGIDTCGIMLEKYNTSTTAFEAFTTPSDAGPNFQSDLTTNGQFGIKFIGLPEGTYRATPYANLSAGGTSLGTAVTFDVAAE